MTPDDEKKRVVLFPRGSRTFDHPILKAQMYTVDIPSILGAYGGSVVFGGCWVWNVFFWIGGRMKPHSRRSRCGWWMDLLRMRLQGFQQFHQ